MENMHALEMLVLRAFMCIILIWTSQGFETRDLVLFLNSDGSLTSSSNTPNCGSGSAIDFISITYQQIQCHYSDGCHTEHEEPLSLAAELQIHKMCSWKEKCNNLSFPLSSIEQTTNTNAIHLTFRCVDRRTTFVNICANGVTHFNNAVYLTSYDNATLYKECRCFVNKGYFSMTISDLRLAHKNDNQCSPAVLLIYSNQSVCDAKREGFGSVFHRQIIPSSINAFISLKLNSPTIIPDMIMLTLTPEVSAKITCYGIETRSSSTPEPKKKSPTTQGMWPFMSNVRSTAVTSVAVQSSTTSYTEQMPENTAHTEQDTNDSYSTLIVVVAVLGLLVLILVPYICWKERKKLERPFQSLTSYFSPSVLESSIAVVCSDDSQPGTEDSFSLVIPRTYVKMYNPKKTITWEPGEWDTLMEVSDADQTEAVSHTTDRKEASFPIILEPGECDILMEGSDAYQTEAVSHTTDTKEASLPLAQEPGECDILMEGSDADQTEAVSHTTDTKEASLPKPGLPAIIKGAEHECIN